MVLPIDGLITAAYTELETLTAGSPASGSGRTASTSKRSPASTNASGARLSPEQATTSALWRLMDRVVFNHQVVRDTEARCLQRLLRSFLCDTPQSTSPWLRLSAILLFSSLLSQDKLAEHLSWRVAAQASMRLLESESSLPNSAKLALYLTLARFCAYSASGGAAEDGNLAKHALELIDRASTAHRQLVAVLPAAKRAQQPRGLNLPFLGSAAGVLIALVATGAPGATLAAVGAIFLIGLLFDLTNFSSSGQFAVNIFAPALLIESCADLLPPAAVEPAPAPLQPQQQPRARKRRTGSSAVAAPTPTVNGVSSGHHNGVAAAAAAPAPAKASKRRRAASKAQQRQAATVPASNPTAITVPADAVSTESPSEPAWSDAPAESEWVSAPSRRRRAKKDPAPVESSTSLANGSVTSGSRNSNSTPSTNGSSSTGTPSQQQQQQPRGGTRTVPSVAARAVNRVPSVPRVKPSAAAFDPRTVAGIDPNFWTITQQRLGLADRVTGSNTATTSTLAAVAAAGAASVKPADAAAQASSAPLVPKAAPIVGAADAALLPKSAGWGSKDFRAPTVKRKKKKSASNGVAKANEVSS